ncbi:MAG: gamma-glutamyltransferase [Sulfuricaulis sp.]|uniref:gamma-glutamyltransferase n=1 Tax=Sulfuricaulis sp. TaxID=2003553 RepID=UPI0025DF5A2B|nr:gamma-glutamyltransferase [Sulfuricaulis sp.]MCR4346886.1 gamma-glutamyltransferase [Sulfuricaulis sp.]
MRDNQYPGRSVVMSTRGMIATSQPMATQAGLAVLQAGGNAMDAAIAASAVLSVTEPQATGIGGDCFLLYHEAKTGKLHGLNGSGRAPARATPEEFERRGLMQVPEFGILSVIVPGAVDAWYTALERFGTRSLEELLQPAIVFAEDGYAVTPVVAKACQNNTAVLAPHAESRRDFMVDGHTPAAGTVHRQPRLAKSLRRIAQGGRDAFYRGPIAEEIVHFSLKHDGLFEMEDFYEYHSEWVEPISTDYRGVRVYEIPPNGQGITALMTLNILEKVKLSGMKHLSVDHLHMVIEAFKLAVAERDEFVADPAFNKLPVEEMLSKEFAAKQFARIDPQRAARYPIAPAARAHRDTVYLSVVDRDRNAVSFINSLYYPYGSGVVAGDTGIMLQNRGAGFVLEPGHFNCIAPRKRPMHTIIPAMAYRGDDILSFGVMGGEYQPMGHVTVLTNWLDFGMDLQEAIDAPRFQPGGGVVALERPVPQEVLKMLQQRGHVVGRTELSLGGAQAIYVDMKNGVLSAGSDPRKDGCALGY